VTEPADSNDGAAQTRAVASAAAALGLSASEPAAAWLVNRIRPGVPGYFLVVFGAPQAAVGLAAVDLATGEVFAKAKLPGRGPHHLLSSVDAIRIAGMGPGTEAVLTWDPGPASSSPFYPLWRLHDGDRTVWVESVTGAVSHTLEAKTGGGKLPP
jgi:hypothetical protein